MSDAMREMTLEELAESALETIIDDDLLTGGAVLQEERDNVYGTILDVLTIVDRRRSTGAERQIDRISKMPDVAAYAGVGDGTVADAVAALVGSIRGWKGGDRTLPPFEEENRDRA